MVVYGRSENTTVSTDHIPSRSSHGIGTRWRSACAQPPRYYQSRWARLTDPRMNRFVGGAGKWSELLGKTQMWTIVHETKESQALVVVITMVLEPLAAHHPAWTAASFPQSGKSASSIACPMVASEGLRLCGGLPERTTRGARFVADFATHCSVAFLSDR